MKFLLDMGIARSVHEFLSEKGHDVVHVRDLDPRAFESGAIIIIEEARHRIRRLPITARK